MRRALGRFPGGTGSRHHRPIRPGYLRSASPSAQAMAPATESCLYLDWNGTTPIFPEVAEAMLPYLSHFGNPSSSHAFGRVCKAAVDQARTQVAGLVGAAPGEIVFTACGTESDNWAIYGAVMAARTRWASTSSGRVPHVVSSAIEHPAIAAHLRHLQQQGLATFTEVAVDGEGLVHVEDVVAALTPDTVLVTLMHSNNEVGSIQPVKEVAAAVKAAQPGVLVHCDAAQSIGKVKVDILELGVDLLTIVGHKFGAPKGIAALYVREGVSIHNLLYGGGQEGGRRAGTENVLLVVGLGKAAEIVTKEAEVLTRHMEHLRDLLQSQLLAAVPQGFARVNGPQDASRRLPNTLSISLKGLSASKALAALSNQLAASAGAACHSTHEPATGPPTISSVLAAMKVPVEFAVGTLRLSVGRSTSKEDIEKAVPLLLAEIKAQGLPVQD